MSKKELNDFAASNGWLESWNEAYDVRENEKADDVSTTLSRLGSSDYEKLCQGYEPQNLLNQDIIRFFFKALLEKELTEKK